MSELDAAIERAVQLYIRLQARRGAGSRLMSQRVAKILVRLVRLKQSRR